jgi:TATA-binding protein-associated factor
MVMENVLERFGIKHLYLNGKVPNKDRIKIVDQFNSDPSYRVLILTTAVGGLGLTLTGADVVIFLEHDWNPMRDL